MDKGKPRINKPFDVTYTISFSGRTIADGVPTTTTPMIRDKIIYLLEDCIAKGFIRDYTITAELNNLKVARKTLAKARKNK